MRAYWNHLSGERPRTGAADSLVPIPLPYEPHCYPTVLDYNHPISCSPPAIAALPQGNNSRDARPGPFGKARFELCTLCRSGIATLVVHNRVYSVLAVRLRHLGIGTTVHRVSVPTETLVFPSET